MLDYIVWDANPVLIDSFVTVRWYGLMFAIGFCLFVSSRRRDFFDYFI